MDEKKYRLDDFELYQLAREFRQKVYRLIKQLPASERYGLDPQMRVDPTAEYLFPQGGSLAELVCALVAWRL